MRTLADKIYEEYKRHPAMDYIAIQFGVPRDTVKMIVEKREMKPNEKIVNQE